jgi:hypothetical protein
VGRLQNGVRLHEWECAGRMRRWSRPVAFEVVPDTFAAQSGLRDGEAGGPAR